MGITYKNVVDSTVSLMPLSKLGIWASWWLQMNVFDEKIGGKKPQETVHLGFKLGCNRGEA